MKTSHTRTSLGGQGPASQMLEAYEQSALQRTIHGTLREQNAARREAGLVERTSTAERLSKLFDSEEVKTFVSKGNRCR